MDMQTVKRGSFYPSIVKTADLNAELNKSLDRLKRASDGSDLGLLEIGLAVEKYANLSSTDNIQAFGWLRLAAAYRRYSQDGEKEGEISALAALTFLNSRLFNAPEAENYRHNPSNYKSRESADSWHRTVQSELNWVLDVTLNGIGEQFKEGWIYNAISDSEMARIRDQIEAAALVGGESPSIEDLDIVDQVDAIKSLRIIADYTDFDSKLATLMEASLQSKKGEIAAAALRYLAKQDDVIQTILASLAC